MRQSSQIPFSIGGTGIQAKEQEAHFSSNIKHKHHIDIFSFVLYNFYDTPGEKENTGEEDFIY